MNWLPPVAQVAIDRKSTDVSRSLPDAPNVPAVTVSAAAVMSTTESGRLSVTAASVLLIVTVPGTRTAPLKMTWSPLPPVVNLRSVIP